MAGFWPPSPAFALQAASLAVGLATLLPLAYLVFRASEAGGQFWELVLRPRTLEVLRNSVLLALAVGLGAAVLGVSLAWLTVRTDLPGRRVWGLLAALPLAIPSLVGGFAFVGALGYGGVLHGWLRELTGFQGQPPVYGFPGAWLLLTLLSYPYVLLPARAALRGTSTSQEEAARLLGLSRWSVFWRVTLRQLRPAAASGSLLAALYALSDFAGVSLLQFDSFTRVIFTYYEASFNRTYPAVLALVLVAISLALVAAETRTRGGARYHPLGTEVRRQPPPVPLGMWRVPALVLCGTVVGLALVLPVGMVAYWLVRGVAHGEPLLLPWGPAYNSLLASLLAALATTGAALPVALLTVRFPSRLARWVEQAVYVSHGLPGIVVALSLVFFGARYATPLYQSLGFLVFAYGVLFLPQALSAQRAALLQVSPALEQAARSLGRSPWAALREVTLPLARSGVLLGAALVFLTAMKELPATLLLSPAGFDTLATVAWGAIGDAYYARAAVPSLLLVAVSLALTALVLWREEGRGRLL